MDSNTLYLRGIYFYVGEFLDDGESSISGYEYLKKAAAVGHRRAAELLSRKKGSSEKAKRESLIPYAALEAAKLGSKKGLDILESHRNLFSAIYSGTEAGDARRIYNSPFYPQKPKISMDDSFAYEIALRYIVGDISGRANNTSSAIWMNKVNPQRCSRANALIKYIQTHPTIDSTQILCVEAAITYGSLKAIKKVTDWHKKGVLTIPDSELIEFAQTVVNMGNIY